MNTTTQEYPVQKKESKLGLEVLNVIRLFLFLLVASSCESRSSNSGKDRALFSEAERAGRRLEVECKRGVGDACVEVAIGYETADPSNLPMAVAAYKKGCESHHAHACGSLGMMRFYGHGIEPNEELGKAEMEASCKLDYGQACANLGIIYALGRGVEVDEKLAQAYFEKGCRLKSETACSALQKD